VGAPNLFFLRTNDAQNKQNRALAPRAKNASADFQLWNSC
jgi:hypothetical protein